MEAPFEGYTSAEHCLEIIFPCPESRISIRYFRELQAQGKIPYLKLGRRTFFNPSEVRFALDKQFKRKAGGNN